MEEHRETRPDPPPVPEKTPARVRDRGPWDCGRGVGSLHQRRTARRTQGEKTVRTRQGRPFHVFRNFRRHRPPQPRKVRNGHLRPGILESRRKGRARHCSSANSQAHARRGESSHPPVPRKAQATPRMRPLNPHTNRRMVRPQARPHTTHSQTPHTTHTRADPSPPGSNNNEVYSFELTQVFTDFPPLNNPWSKATFDKNIAQNVGVYTTHETKVFALSELLASLLKNQVSISKHLVSTGPKAFNQSEDEVVPEEQLDVLIAQLKAFTDHADGSISGKGSGDEDDAGMALLLASSWSVRIKAAAAGRHEKTFW